MCQEEWRRLPHAIVVHRKNLIGDCGAVEDAVPHVNSASMTDRDTLRPVPDSKHDKGLDLASFELR
jgi:hypothetical protein